MESKGKPKAQKLMLVSGQGQEGRMVTVSRSEQCQRGDVGEFLGEISHG